VVARIVWKANDVVSLKLREDLFTIGQLLRKPYMRFFKVAQPHGVWQNIDLNQEEVLFCVLVGRIVLQNLAVGKIKDESVKPSQLPFEKFWIRSRLNFDGGYPIKGGDLVEVDPNIGYVHAPVVKAELGLPEDADIIGKYELVGMWGDRDLAERLITFFDTGQDFDGHKAKVFDQIVR
jgi:hypothetical protein